MLFTFEKREDLEKIEELASLQNQVEELRLQDKLGEKFCHEDMKNLYEPLSDTIKNTSETLTKTLMETSIKNKKRPENLDDKFSEISKDRGIITSYFSSLLSEITYPEHASQFKLVKCPSSSKVNDILLNKTIPVTLYNNLLIFCDTDKKNRSKSRSFKYYNYLKK